MAEDPDLSRQRIEQQQLRRQLNEVFGPFEQFCEYVAGTNSAGSSGIMRHGVVQIPTTPILSSRSMLTSSAPTPSPNTHQSTQQLLQSMQNLVTSPIQPLQGMPFSCNRDYLNTAPSSSTHTNSESRDSAKKGKRYRTMDSDSEVEREKRRRGREDSRSSGQPGNSGSSRTQQSSSNSDGLRALFGGSSDRKEPPDKGISPDSGIHSAENDPGDENDVHSAQTIINLITRLSPPLSPIKQRPIDKKAERERREAEQRERERRREREEAERLERERLERERLERLERERKEKEERERKEKEEREQQEKEQAERERVRRENERLEHERRERERKEKEREEKERKEKEQQEREREERREREREERKREREHEEKMRKEKEEEKLRREMRKQKEKERSSNSEKKPKEMNDRTEGNLERKERTKNTDMDKSESSSERKRDENASRLDGLRGEILLRGLDRSKLKQLVEIGRRAGRLKEDYKEDGKEASAKEEKRKEKREKEKEKEREKKSKDRLSIEDALRKSAKLPSAKSSPCLPRAGSSQSHEDQASHSRPSSAISNHPSRSGFECAAHECVPLRPARPVKPEEGSTELLYDFYHSIAKSRKRKGDAEADKVARVLLYLDAAAYFILSAKHFNPPDGNENRANRQYSIIRDTGDLLKKTTNMFLAQTDSSPPLHAHMSSRIRNLSLRCQACLMYHLYNLRSSNALKTYSMLAQMEAQLQEEQAQNGSSAQNTSSPGSSVHSNSNQSATVVTMPTRVYEVQRQQLKTLHQLMFAHRAWQDAVKRADVSTTDMGFIGGLEKICGATFLDASLEKMSAFVLTGIAWLRAEYEREKLRPPPPVVKRNAAPS